tara:strand:- start:30 stop:248 length:219 start_codon:yes stop_codon:yes gene_type:complete
MKWIAIAITVSKKTILFPCGGLINRRTKMTDKEIINELVLMLTFDYADLISEADQEIIEQRLQKMGLQGERR